MSSKQYWEKFYQSKRFKDPSSFAQFCLPFIGKRLTELGCGDGRDVRYFHEHAVKVRGVDQAFDGVFIDTMDIETYISKYKPTNHVYTRFFWHSINRDIQLKILDWVKEYLYIEARTIADQKTKKKFGQHERYYVDVAQLVADLKSKGFEILYLKEGLGMSIYKGENPHLVRVIARKTT